MIQAKSTLVKEWLNSLMCSLRIDAKIRWVKDFENLLANSLIIHLKNGMSEEFQKLTSYSLENNVSKNNKLIRECSLEKYLCN